MQHRRKHQHLHHLLLLPLLLSIQGADAAKGKRKCGTLERNNPLTAHCFPPDGASVSLPLLLPLSSLLAAGHALPLSLLATAFVARIRSLLPKQHGEDP